MEVRRPKSGSRARPEAPLHAGRPRVGQLPIDDDVRKELDFHLEMRTQELIASGWDPEAARLEAERAFGDRSNWSAECERITQSTDRAERWFGFLERIGQDVRYGLRILKNSPAFSVVAMVTLALGIGANTAIFSLAYTILLKPLPYPDSERIVSVQEHQPDRGRRMSVAGQNFRDWAESSDDFAPSPPIARRPSHYAAGPSPSAPSPQRRRRRSRPSSGGPCRGTPPG